MYNITFFKKKTLIFWLSHHMFYLLVTFVCHGECFDVYQLYQMYKNSNLIKLGYVMLNAIHMLENGLIC